MDCQKRKIIIPSKGRSKIISTHKYLDKYNLDYTIVVHSDKEKKEYVSHTGIDPLKIVSSGVTGFLPEQREWILRNLTDKNEWVIYLDDNIKHITAIQSDHYKKDELDSGFVGNNNKLFRNLFDQEITGERFLQICEEMIEIGECKAAFLCGFATTDNPFFRCKKFKYYSYVIGKAMVRKTTNVSFPVGWFCQEDYHDTAQHLLTYGKVLVNNFVKPIATHYQIGGIGTYEKRLPYKLDLNKKLMQKFPGLFRYNDKVNCPKGSEVIIRLSSEKQIENWRAEMLRNINGHC